MPKSENQKLKLLYLKDIFENSTDEDHPLSAQQLIEMLAQQGVHAERKSLYDDIRTLQDYGMDILCTKAKSTGYYLGGRLFETAELKLLVDAVQSSRFLSRKKSTNLIKKLEQLANTHHAQELNRQVYVTRRVKTPNESVYYTIDSLYTAISHKRQVSFLYMRWNADKTSVVRRGGARYTVSPYALLWDDENYYLVAWDAAAGQPRHYRVDKMEQLTVTDLPREGEDEFGATDMAEYARSHAGMYGGEEVSIRLRVQNDFANVVFDRFGTEMTPTRVDDNHFDISFRAVPSPVLLGWLASFRGALAVVSPPEVRDAMATLCADTLHAHEGK